MTGAQGTRCPRGAGTHGAVPGHAFVIVVLRVKGGSVRLVLETCTVPFGPSDFGINGKRYLWVDGGLVTEQRMPACALLLRLWGCLPSPSASLTFLCFCKSSTFLPHRES